MRIKKKYHEAILSLEQVNPEDTLLCPLPPQAGWAVWAGSSIIYYVVCRNCPSCAALLLKIVSQSKLLHPGVGWF